MSWVRFPSPAPLSSLRGHIGGTNRLGPVRTSSPTMDRAPRPHAPIRSGAMPGCALSEVQRDAPRRTGPGRRRLIATTAGEGLDWREAELEAENARLRCTLDEARLDAARTAAETIE